MVSTAAAARLLPARRPANHFDSPGDDGQQITSFQINGGDAMELSRIVALVHCYSLDEILAGEEQSRA